MVHHDIHCIAYPEAIRVYTDGSGIRGRVGTAAVCLDSPICCQRYLGTDVEHTVPVAEIARLVLALRLLKRDLVPRDAWAAAWAASAGPAPYGQRKRAEIYSDNQGTAYTTRTEAGSGPISSSGINESSDPGGSAANTPRQPPENFHILSVERHFSLQRPGEIHSHIMAARHSRKFLRPLLYTSAAFTVTAADNCWTSSIQCFISLSIGWRHTAGLLVMSSRTARRRRQQAGAQAMGGPLDAWIRQHTKEQWEEAWWQSEHGRHLRDLLPNVTKRSISLYDDLTPVERSVAPETIHHVLSGCTRYDDLRRAIWTEGTPRNLTEALTEKRYVRRAARFMLDTGRLTYVAEATQPAWLKPSAPQQRTASDSPSRRWLTDRYHILSHTTSHSRQYGAATLGPDPRSLRGIGLGTCGIPNGLAAIFGVERGLYGHLGRREGIYGGSEEAAFPARAKTE
ncbi:hypothetical protein CNMCM5623_004802 [Aspergillus felis]|uniref:Uncharacterized protein n=1 Tax=Aspergillus felis TaxID=1287682 RepID=A0A8H6V059_9EURO|nr:hypothetical protein CNMCM5623_004802 [Aspergillus felis]